MNELLEMLTTAKTVVLYEDTEFNDKQIAILPENAEDEFFILHILNGKFHSLENSYFTKNWLDDEKIVKAYPEYKEYTD